MKLCNDAITSVSSKKLDSQDPSTFAAVCSKCMLISLAAGDTEKSSFFAKRAGNALDIAESNGIEDRQGLRSLLNLMDLTSLPGMTPKFQ